MITPQIPASKILYVDLGLIDWKSHDDRISVTWTPLLHFSHQAWVVGVFMAILLGLLCCCLGLLRLSYPSS